MSELRTLNVICPECGMRVDIRETALGAENTLTDIASKCRHVGVAVLASCPTLKPLILEAHRSLRKV
jgi:succinate dehydrogenase/fumarate reductase-like Fe-S protein